MAALLAVARIASSAETSPPRRRMPS